MSHAGKLRLTVVALLGTTVAASCRDRQKTPTAPPADTIAQLDTQTAAIVAPDTTASKKPGPLSPLADSIAERMVFPPRGQLWFTAAARGKRMLVDIGRVDMDVKTEPRLSAYLEAVKRLSPIPVGARFRLSGPWGADSAVLEEYASWNGRIVGVLAVAPRVDSLARTVEPLPAAAAITDSAVPSVTDSCKRDSLGEELSDRAAIVRDSISQQILETAKPPYERLQNSLKVSSSRIVGCYGRFGRVLVIVSARAGNTEWVAERMAIVDDTGAVTPLRFSDYRFDAHDGVYAFDADRDGIDDLATRALGESMGGLSIMRLDTARKRLDRLTAGFSWESR
jgi:hypothetical protein